MANNTAKAESKNANVQASKAETQPVQAQSKKEPTYTVEEFVSAPETVGANVDIVKAALLSGGKESYTISEANEIVKKFKSKEVK